MNPMIEIHGVSYPLATTLRVAYKVQGHNNHKPYSQVFSEIGDMTLEKQIEILFVAFQVANPEATMSQMEFMNYYLDHYNLKVMLDQVKEVIQGITGMDPENQEKNQSSTDTEQEK